MRHLPDGAKILAEHQATDGRIACRTYIWRSVDGTFGALLLEATRRGTRVRRRFTDIPSLRTLDQLLTYEVTTNGPDGRPLLPMLQSAAGAFEKVTQHAA